MNTCKFMFMAINIFLYSYISTALAAQHEKINRHLKTQQLLDNEEIVFVDTNDDTLMTIPRWQIAQMPTLYKQLLQAKKEHGFNMINCFNSKTSISAAELKLLSNVWVEMKKGKALPFLDTLPRETLLILNNAADKVGSGLLYATTMDRLMPRDVLTTPIQALAAPSIKVLALISNLGGLVRLVGTENQKIFNNIDIKQNDAQSPDYTKYVARQFGKAILYDISNDFKPQELGRITEIGLDKKYRFSSDSRMFFAVPKEEKNAQFFCWDTRNDLRKYTIKYQGLIDNIENVSDGSMLIFTEYNELDTKKPHKVCVCYLTENEPVRYEIASTIKEKISLICASPKNDTFACIAGRQLYIYCKEGTEFNEKKPLWSDNQKIDQLLQQEQLTKNELNSIGKYVFNSDGTKIICVSEHPKNQYKALLSLYELRKNDFTLVDATIVKKNDNLSINDISLDFAKDTCAIATGISGFYYWKSNDSILTIEASSEFHENINSIKLSHDANMCIFRYRNKLKIYNHNDSIAETRFAKQKNMPTSDCGIYNLRNAYLNDYSIKFDQDDKKIFFIEYDKNKKSITKNILTFDDYSIFTLGQAQFLSDIYYYFILRLHSTSSRHKNEIIKYTLSYELFETLPKMIKSGILYLYATVIDNPPAELPEQDYYEMVAKEAPREIRKTETIKKLRRKLRKSNVVTPVVKAEGNVVTPIVKVQEKVISSPPSKEDKKLEKSKEIFRKYLTVPALKTAEGLPNKDKIAQIIGTLKSRYEPESIDYRALTEVAKEMGLE